MTPIIVGAICVFVLAAMVAVGRLSYLSGKFKGYTRGHSEGWGCGFEHRKQEEHDRCNRDFYERMARSAPPESRPVSTTEASAKL